jgi:hypothetical protein
MLEKLNFENIGPSKRMDLAFADRLNILTGDNGLGKTFVLDAAWWALTRNWPEDGKLQPDPSIEHPSAIGYKVHGITGPMDYFSSVYDYTSETGDWPLPNGRPPITGLIIYARVDGSFSIWDPARNYWRPDNNAPEVSKQRPPAYHFNRDQIWKGLWRTPKDEYEKNRDALICRGLIEDLVSWKLDETEKPSFDAFQRVLATLSPDAAHPYRIGPLGELLGWPGKLPTLETPEFPSPVLIKFVSAGVRRILALAYALVWAWVEHQRALRLTKQTATEANRIVLLIDEIETHLHPKWQRSILPAILDATKELFGAKTPVQVVISTHSPLVLSSLETRFNEKSDKLLNFECHAPGEVEIEYVKWAKFGDASGWLTSPAFDMDSGYSKEAETAMNAADAFMEDNLYAVSTDFESIDAIHAALKSTLDGGDPYWPLWLPFYRQQKGEK